MHQNIHNRCKLKHPVKCLIGYCVQEFYQLDVFLGHLRRKHRDTYLKLWQQSNFAFNPTANQFINGIYALIGMFDSRGKKGVRWFRTYDVKLSELENERPRS